MLSAIEKTRLRVSERTDAMKKSRLGQFLTPASTATFMASLFPEANGECRLLDAGAGIGSLSSAFLDRCVNGDLNFSAIRLSAFEIDAAIHFELDFSLSQHTKISGFSFEIIGKDFIEEAVNAIQFKSQSYTHAILNPPYKKIDNNSNYRHLLRAVGIETVNLYSAFVALAVEMGAPGAQIVAIIPRSFCNGPYYRPFRDFILKRSAVQHIHLFDSRSKAFKDDEVLQENVIIQLECGGMQGAVAISKSTDDSFLDIKISSHPFEAIVLPGDSQRFIHIPSESVTEHERSINSSSLIKHSLTELGIRVSTGPVVDFRLKQHLRAMPEFGTVPLLYPSHFSSSAAKWPQREQKKPNAIHRNSETERWLYPNGFYCVVRRFSSKEERRRVVAGVVDPASFGDATVLGFENHLNLFHENKNGLPQALARGLTVFLNSTSVDDSFRRFSGHTQVNATDLKQLKYPNRDVLTALGEWAMQVSELTQLLIDEKIGSLTT